MTVVINPNATSRPPVDVSVSDYASLRNYQGSATTVQVTGYLGTSAPSGIAGTFTRDDSDTTTPDNGVTVIVSSNGKRWKRAGTTVDFEMAGAAGDGTTDDTAALTNAIASGKKIVAQRGKTYKFSSTLTITEKHIDFSGATLLYTGAKNVFAMVINSPNGVQGSTDVRNFLLKLDPTNIDTTNRTHGLCLGGSAGSIDNFRVEGFTGISVALGSGAESYTGVTLPATQQCYYWKVANFNISSTAGWNLVVPFANNANHFLNVSTFPWNGFSQSPTRSANCIDEIVIGGTGNTLERVSLEGAPSNRMILFLATASGNRFLGTTYLERNASWATPPFPRVEAQAQSSSNYMLVRHPYAGTPFSDLGTANEFRATPAFYVNGSQYEAHSGGISMVKNGRFENGSTGWSDFSTAGTMSFGTGYRSGKSMRIDVVAGRPNILQSLVTVGGYTLASLQGQNITVSGMVKTDLTGISIKVAGATQNQVPSDGNWFPFVATVKVPAAAATVELQLISESSGLTGYVEWSDVTAVLGNEPLACGPRDPLDGSVTFNPPSLAAGATQQTTVTVTGAAVGDLVSSVSHSQVSSDIVWFGQVTAADTVTVTQWNRGAGAIDLASGTLRVRVQKV